MYLPHTDAERDVMLKAIGVEKIEDFFHMVPAAHRFPKLNLPDSLSEMEVLAEMQASASANASTQELICFLGAGAYHHYIPSVVDAVLRRGEFYSAYTPYQPELSQGTLQSMFEYQSLVTALTGMEVSNASHYDGATSVAEAVSMANAHFRGKRDKVVLSPALHPHYIETVKTYNMASGVKLVGVDADPFSAPETLLPLIDAQTMLVVVAYPDFFGRVYDYAALADAVHAAGALFCVSVNPTALGLLTPPGDFGADIVTGEGQPLGIPLSFGGPYLGLFATRKEYVRKMAGRLVGETVDSQGRRAYVLTLTAREQHIRREKATSNICTNVGLMALASAVYMSALGKHGMRQVAELCFHKAHYAAKQIAAVRGYKVLDSTPFFHEFVVECPTPVAEINEHLLEHSILGGYDLGQAYPHIPGMAQRMLVAVTEMVSKEEIDLLVEALSEVNHD